MRQNSTIFGRKPKRKLRSSVRDWRVCAFQRRQRAEDLQVFLDEWGIDDTIRNPGGLKKPHRVPPPRKVYLLQRKTSKVGDGLGMTTDWIHRTVLKHNQVEMIAGVSYVKIDDAGLHILVGSRPEVLDVDNVIVCAGHLQRALHQQLEHLGLKSHLIGGADKALELDAKRAIDQGARLAATI